MNFACLACFAGICRFISLLRNRLSGQFCNKNFELLSSILVSWNFVSVFGQFFMLMSHDAVCGLLEGPRGMPLLSLMIAGML